MSFPHLQHQDVGQLQKLNQLQQLQQLNFSPQIQQRGLNPQFVQQQQQVQQAQQQQQQQQQQAQQQQAQQQFQIPQQIPPQILQVKEVWNDNFLQELKIIRLLINKYNYVSFSTEFPGTLARPIGVFSSTDDYHYQTLRANADLLNLIQFGISLSDAEGKKPDNIYSTWLFNFKFDLSSKMISNEAYESLIKTGIDFRKHTEQGIDQFEFAEMLTSSGLVLLPDVHWTSFHAGYDFGFLISLLTNNMMPSKEEEFFAKVATFFPKLYDLKIISKYGGNNANKDTIMKQTLEILAEDLGIPRNNVFVSTGGQALLTNFCFAELKKRIGSIDKFAGVIHGLSSEGLVSGEI